MRPGESQDLRDTQIQVKLIRWSLPRLPLRGNVSHLEVKGRSDRRKLVARPLTGVATPSGRSSLIGHRLLSGLLLVGKELYEKPLKFRICLSLFVYVDSLLFLLSVSPFQNCFRNSGRFRFQVRSTVVLTVSEDF